MSITLSGKILSWVKIVLLIYLLVHPFSLMGHNKIAKIINTAVDTSQCKSVQAKQIYEWITNNIAYDTKQLTNGLKNQSTSQILRRKKAVCSGYTRLFNEMCQELEIKSYNISGYTKGFAYVEGDHFNKSSHTWNAVHIDSLWLLVDATWGAGSISYTHSFLSELKSLITGRCGVKNKIVYHKKYNSKYFNIAPNELVLTHFPNDPKWQLLESALPYHTFINDSVQSFYYIDYRRELRQCQYQNIMRNAFVDARNSIKYNPYNRFDIGMEYYRQALLLLPNKHSVYDSTLLVQLNRGNIYFDSCMVFINQFRTISKSIYRNKVSNLSGLYKEGNRAFTRLYKLSSNKAESHSKTNEKLEFILVRINEQCIALENTIQDVSHHSKCPFDSLQLSNKLIALTAKLCENKNYTSLYAMYINLASLNAEVQHTMQKYMAVNDSLIRVIKSIEVAYRKIAKSINEMNQLKSYVYFSSLDTLETKHRSLYHTRKILDKNLSLKIKEAESVIKMMERDVFSEDHPYEIITSLTDSMAIGDYSINRGRLLLYKIFAINRDIHFNYKKYIQYAIFTNKQQQQQCVYFKKK